MERLSQNGTHEPNMEARDPTWDIAIQNYLYKATATIATIT
jgi:hypothetical protein